MTGLDASQAMLDRCARRARPIPLVRANFWVPLAFDNETFDAALALHGTLAHAPDDDAIGRLASELARVIRPQGVWISEVPSPTWLDRLEVFSRHVDRRLRRTGPNTCIYEDVVVGAAIEARVLSEAAWMSALGASWDCRLEPLGELEWTVIARRK